MPTSVTTTASRTFTISPQGVRGVPGLNPRGDYDPTATYLLRDAVTYDVTNDRAYVFARRNLTANTPPSVDGDGMIISDANWYVLMRMTKGGWSPIFGSEIDGLRVVQKITDWTGGEGTKPATGYIGASGIVSDIADGLDIAGPLTSYFDTQKTAAETARSGAEAAATVVEGYADLLDFDAVNNLSVETDNIGTVVRYRLADGSIYDALTGFFTGAADISREDVSGYDLIIQDDVGGVYHYAGSAANSVDVQAQAIVDAATPGIEAAAIAAAAANLAQQVDYVNATPLETHEDQSGAVFEQTLADGSKQGIGYTLGSDGAVDTTVFNISHDTVSGYEIIVQTDSGDVLMTLGDTGLSVPGQTSASSGYTQAEILSRSDAAVAASLAFTAQKNPTFKSALTGTTHLITLGQSLSYGSQSYPAITLTARPGNYMLGLSDKPNNTATWNPVDTTATGTGSTALHGLVGTTLDQSTFYNTVMSPSGEAALLTASPWSNNPSESPVVGLTNHLRDLWQMEHFYLSADSFPFIASSVGQPGTTVEYGAGPQAMARYYDCVSAAEARVVSDSLPAYSQPVVVHMQGEGNYTDTAASYGPKQVAVRDAIQTQRDSLGLTDPWAFVTYQTAMPSMSNSADGGPAQAQWNNAQSQSNWYLATPTYFVPKRPPHLTCNGSRWVGAMIGKVVAKILAGERWLPLSPSQITYRGSEVLMDFHVPCPPLATRAGFSTMTQVNYSDLGFSYYDSSGAITPVTTTVYAGAIHVVLTRAPSGYLLVRYADLENHANTGNVCDSDASVALDTYVYNAGSGQDAAEDVPALVGKPYDLRNALIAFHQLATAN